MLRAPRFLVLASAVAFALQGAPKPPAKTAAPVAPPPPPEIRIDFFSKSAPSADLEVEVSVFGVPKSEGAEPAKPQRFTRAGVWRAGGVDVHELAKLVADAIGQGHFDVTQDGARVIFRDITEVTVRASSWSAIGAQVSAMAPTEPKSRPLSVLVDLGATKPAAEITLLSSTRGSGAPEPANVTATTEAPPAKGGSKGKTAPAPPPAPKKPDPKKPDAKPADPKAKTAGKPQVPIAVAAGTDGTALRESLVKAATDAGWKVEAKELRAFLVTGAPEGAAPKWVAIRVSSDADVRFGVKLGEP